MSESNHKIEELRKHLFETIESLKDKTNPMPLDRAKTIAEVASVIVDTAKAETAHLHVVGGRHGSGFIKDGKPAPAMIEHKKG